MPDDALGQFREGGCQCGEIRYRFTAEPLGVWACHCSECRRQSGSAFGMSMILPLDALEFTSGEPAVWTRTAASGHVVDCLFCRTCGSRIAHRRHDHGGRITLKPGTLDERDWFVPEKHFFTEDAPSWLEPLIDHAGSSSADASR